MTLEEEVLFIIEAHREAIKKAPDVAEAETDFQGVLLKLRIEGSISLDAHQLVSQLYGYNSNKAASPKVLNAKRAKLSPAKSAATSMDDLEDLWTADADVCDKDLIDPTGMGPYLDALLATKKSMTAKKPKPPVGNPYSSNNSYSSGCGGSSTPSSHC